MPLLKKYPFYLRSTVILFGLILLTYALANLREILIPLSFALFLAMLLNPLNNRLLEWKVPKVLSIILSLLIAIILISGLWYFLATQIMHFTDQLPLLKKKSADLMTRLQGTLTEKLNLSLQKQNQYLDEAKAGIKPLIGQTLGTVAGTLSMIFLLPM